MMLVFASCSVSYVRLKEEHFKSNLVHPSFFPEELRKR